MIKLTLNTSTLQYQLRIAGFIPIPLSKEYGEDLLKKYRLSQPNGKIKAVFENNKVVGYLLVWRLRKARKTANDFWRWFRKYVYIVRIFPNTSKEIKI